MVSQDVGKNGVRNFSCSKPWLSWCYRSVDAPQWPGQTSWLALRQACDNLGVVGACRKGLSLKELLASVLQSAGRFCAEQGIDLLLLPGYATTGQMHCREGLHLLLPFGGSWTWVVACTRIGDACWIWEETLPCSVRSEGPSAWLRHAICMFAVASAPS